MFYQLGTFKKPNNFFENGVYLSALLWSRPEITHQKKQATASESLELLLSAIAE